MRYYRKCETLSFILGIYLIILIAGICGCKQSTASDAEKEASIYTEQRREMIEGTIKSRGVTNEDVLSAMQKVQRHLFVDPQLKEAAYEDQPLPIGHGQTISQPYIVAVMTEFLKLKQDSRVLEIGTGSGYQAAILGEIVKEVYTIEIIPELAKTAEDKLKQLGYQNIYVKAGDGNLGWPEYAPFDGIIVTAAGENIPEPLIEQLKPGGRMIIPVGPAGQIQYLTLIEKEASGLVQQKKLMPVSFVPLVNSTDNF